MLHFVLPQPRIGLVHIAHDDRDVLKPAIIAAGIDRNRPTLGREIFSELNVFIAQLHANHTHSQPKYAFEMFVILSGQFNVRYFLECEHLRIEVNRTVHVRDGDSDCVDAIHQSRLLSEPLRYDQC